METDAWIVEHMLTVAEHATEMDGLFAELDDDFNSIGSKVNCSCCLLPFCGGCGRKKDRLERKYGCIITHCPVHQYGRFNPTIAPNGRPFVGKNLRTGRSFSYVWAWPPADDDDDDSS